MSIDMRRLDGITLSVGGHASPEDGLCVMEAAAFLAGEAHTDRPECVRADLATAARDANDRGPQWVRDALMERLPRLVGTAGGDPGPTRWIWADCAARQLAPLALRAAGLIGHAERLEALPEVVDAETALTAADTYAAVERESAIYAAESAIYAAEAAATGAHATAAAEAAQAAHGTAAYADDAWRIWLTALDRVLEETGIQILREETTST